MSGPLQTVHVRVNDAVAGRPTPVRLRVTDAEGNYYPPLGRLAKLKRPVNVAAATEASTPTIAAVTIALPISK